MNSSQIRALLAAVPLPLILVGRDERLVAANPAATELFGTLPEGRPYMTGVRAPALIDCIEAALVSGHRSEARHIAQREGREEVWRVVAEPVGHGDQPAVLVSFEDLTPAEAAIQMRRDFVANVSHELKTPLTALIGFIETLQGAAQDDKVAHARFLAIMAREAGRMNRLVSDLLSLSRVESEERVRPTARVELRGLVSSVLSALKPQAESRGVSVDVTGAAEAVVLGDADQLTQVFTNLIENALKYGGAGGNISVNLVPLAREVAFGGPGIRVEVVDEGEGFDPLHIPRLTERFYRIDDHRAREEGGTGLGLAIVKHIVNRHRGRLRIESAPGEGSRFSVILPLAEAPGLPAGG